MEKYIIKYVILQFPNHKLVTIRGNVKGRSVITVKLKIGVTDRLMTIKLTINDESIATIASDGEKNWMSLTQIDKEYSERMNAVNCQGCDPNDDGYCLTCGNIF